MREVERLDEVQLTLGVVVERVDVRHVVAERDDADPCPVVVHVQTADQGPREVHDELVLGLDAARQIQYQNDVVQRRTGCTPCTDTSVRVRTQFFSAYSQDVIVTPQSTMGYTSVVSVFR